MAVRGIYQPPITTQEGVEAHGDSIENYLRMLGAEATGWPGDLEGLLRSIIGSGIGGTTMGTEPNRDDRLVDPDPALPTVEDMAEITGGDPDAPGAGAAMVTAPDLGGPLGELLQAIPVLLGAKKVVKATGRTPIKGKEIEVHDLENAGTQTNLYDPEGEFAPDHDVGYVRTRTRATPEGGGRAEAVYSAQIADQADRGRGYGTAMYEELARALGRFESDDIREPHVDHIYEDKLAARPGLQVTPTDRDTYLVRKYDADQTRPDAPFPQYAKDYPPVADPVMGYERSFRPEGTRLQGEPTDGPFTPVDAKGNKAFFTTGERDPYGTKAAGGPPIPYDQAEDVPYSKAWPAKGKNKEGAEFMKERLKVRKDVAEGNFEPYFDPEYRHDARKESYDPRPQYPMPKKQETIDKWRGKVKTPEGKQRLTDAYNRGVESGGHDAWYKMGQLEAEFIDELGPVEGPKMFKERFADSMAATTGKASPETNFIMASYANFKRQRGDTLPLEARNTPVPVGGKYSEANLTKFDKAINEGAGMADNPKRSTFSHSFLGDADIATIDEHMTDLITPGLAAPPGDSYFAYEELIQETAQELGITARELQEVAWGGRKVDRVNEYEGKAMIEIVNEAIERTARLTGKSPKEVVRKGIVRGDMPIYGVAATAGLGGLAAALANQQEGLDDY